MLVETPELDSSDLQALEQIWLLQRELAPKLNEPKVWTGGIRRQALARSIRYSIGIEGYRASESQATELLLSDQVSNLESQTYRALSGYRQAMGFVLSLATTRGFQIDETFIRAIHFMVLGGDASKSAGLYRKGEIFVFDDRSGLAVHEGSEASAVPDLMSALTKRLGSRKPELSIIDAAMAHLNLVLIHPFQDGNGRVARILQSAVLASEEKPSPVFLSIEEYLGLNTARYYEVLAEVGQGKWNSGADARPWTRFVLAAHLEQLELTKNHWAQLNNLWRLVAELVSDLGLNERVVPAVVHSASGNRLTNQLYRELLAEAGDSVSMLTASRDLNLLCEMELLNPEGDNRARSYKPGRLLLELKLSSGRPTG